MMWAATSGTGAWVPAVPRHLFTESSYARAFSSRHGGTHRPMHPPHSGRRAGGSGVSVHRWIHIFSHGTRRLLRPRRCGREGHRRRAHGCESECDGLMHRWLDVQGWSRRLLGTRRHRVRRSGTRAENGTRRTSRSRCTTRTPRTRSQRLACNRRLGQVRRQRPHGRDREVQGRHVLARRASHRQLLQTRWGRAMARELTGFATLAR
jgi:hypothetical protein